MDERIAIIDLGSNSVRLMIMEIYADNSFKVINEVKETVRLSEGMNKENILQPDAIRRTLQVLRLFKSLCSSNKVRHLIAIATAAVRTARNREEFLHIVKLDTGISFEVISGEKEAALGFRAVEFTMNIEEGFCVDIGGASTEITRFKNKKIINSISLPFGAVNLTEKFLDKGANTQKTVQVLEKFLAAQYKKVPWLRKSKDASVLVGLGGTIRTLCKIDRSRKAYSLNMTHNYEMEYKDIEEIYHDIRLMDLEKRMSIPGMSKERADIIIAGSSAIYMLLKAIGTSKLIVSGSGIREGVFYDYYLNQQMQGEIRNISEFSVNNIIKRYNINIDHARQVRSLALDIYDQLEPIHKLPKECSEIISRAALLNDAGIMIDFYNRDEHTYYLITNSRISGLLHREIIMTALVAAKFTGNKFKKYCHYHKDIISKEDYIIIRKLIIMLSICDKLDKSKSRMLEGFNCSISNSKVIIKISKTGGYSELEIAEASKLKVSFKKIFGKSLEII